MPVNQDAAHFYGYLCFAWILLFLFSFVALVMHVRDRRYPMAGAALLLTGINYTFMQCLDSAAVAGRPMFPYGPAHFVVGLPRPLLLLLYAGLALAACLLFADVLRYERTHITGRSIKEAADSLPVGICFYRPDGRPLMVNRTMEALCRSATGGELFNGESFCTQLYSGELRSPCTRSMVGDSPLIVLPDGSAWSLQRQEAPFEGAAVRVLYAYDITETYRKTASLQRMQEEVTALNERLAAYNQEIVALTTEREILNAKVRIHEELGGILLSMKRLLPGGTPSELSALRERLRRNIFFILTEPAPDTARDEYELILETAETLGVHIRLDGALPEERAQKHILATAIHECITNTLRHAHGNELTVTCAEAPSPEGTRIRAVFTNNGSQPEGEIRETGGLGSLRSMVEAAGGAMTVRTAPVFSITVELPKEEHHGV